jgi:urocanate hydratase
MPDFKDLVAAGIPETLPEMPPLDDDVNHAPARPMVLDDSEKRLAIANALRYFPEQMHAGLASEFARELANDGRIYMRRFRPTYEMYARPISEYPARSREAAAIMMMITNNLNPAVAQHPHELVTYGGNGTVFQNWAQYLLSMKYLSEMTDEQTLVLYSGHPLGLFPSAKSHPRLVLTCGMMVPDYSTPDEYTRLSALGVTSYGQMTAGSFMYIGPQGIVHGTTITLLNAGRKYLGIDPDKNLGGVVYVTSGLGGMSGAQAKAATITGSVGVIAEINPKAARKRHEQGWVDEIEDDLDKVLKRTEQAKKNRQPLSLAYVGNIVDLWERLAEAGMKVELGSDQTSLHIPFTGGYYPAGLTYEQSNEMMKSDPEGFKEKVQESLRRQVVAIDRASAMGLKFWDYGNAFLLEAGRAGALSLFKEDGRFVYPSYVEDIMGPMCFDFGFGPFRWVCTSGDPKDLAKTDEIAASVIEEMLKTAPSEITQQLRDNLMWIRAAGENEMVVGSQARILYSNSEGRIRIARSFNEAIRNGVISEPVVLGRDHHDVGGTDSPYRETANIYDGSDRCADMAVHNYVGDAFRGATWVSLHNGGGTGWGQAINGGFGMVLDGSEDYDRRIDEMMFWDVNNGIARRAWAGNDNAVFTATETMKTEPRLKVTLPSKADPALVEQAKKEAFDS